MDTGKESDFLINAHDQYLWWGVFTKSGRLLDVFRDEDEAREFQDNNNTQGWLVRAVYIRRRKV